MIRINSLYKKSSVDSYYLGYYVPIDIPFDETDVLFTIDKKYNHRPGKLALDLYSDERFGWVFSYFNRDKIQDPIFDLKAGMTIRIPTAQRLNTYI